MWAQGRDWSVSGLGKFQASPLLRGRHLPHRLCRGKGACWAAPLLSPAPPEQSAAAPWIVLVRELCREPGVLGHGQVRGWRVGRYPFQVDMPLSVPVFKDQLQSCRGTSRGGVLPKAFSSAQGLQGTWIGWVEPQRNLAKSGAGTAHQKQSLRLTMHMRNVGTGPVPSLDDFTTFQDPSSIAQSGRSTGGGISYPLQYSWASLVAQLVKNPPAMQETWVQSLGWEDSLEKGMATHSSILAWWILWTEKPGRLQSIVPLTLSLSWQVCRESFSSSWSMMWS